MSHQKQSIVIVGSGLVGSLAAIYMAERHGFNVTVYEKRSDLRKGSAEAGRSINLVLTSRGIYALRQVGLDEAAIKLAVPVKGRTMHAKDGKLTYQPYGISANEVNYSISRTKLNCFLMDEAEKRGVKIHFNQDLVDLDLIAMKASFRNSEDKTISIVSGVDSFIGTDGAGSPTRQFILQHLRAYEGVAASDYAERLGISYKEVTFPAARGGGRIMNGDSMHVWPRGPAFLMGLADLEGSFTGTLYVPDGSAKLNIPGVESVPLAHKLQEDNDLTDSYIKQEYPDVPGLVPDLQTQLSTRAFSFLATLRTTHWHAEGKAIVIGDAGHAVTPFFGQGMNLGFESLVVLSNFIKASPNQDLKLAYRAFTAHHKPSAVSLADMAIENFTELSYLTGLPDFLRRKGLENYVETKFPSRFRSRYYMVTKTLIPYRTVQDAGFVIDACLDKWIAYMDKHNIQGPEQLPHGAITEVLDSVMKPFLEQRGIVVSDPMKDYYVKGGVATAKL